jgi:hypothetical protein
MTHFNQRTTMFLNTGTGEGEEFRNSCNSIQKVVKRIGSVVNWDWTKLLSNPDPLTKARLQCSQAVLTADMLPKS